MYQRKMLKAGVAWSSIMCFVKKTPKETDVRNLKMKASDGVHVWLLGIPPLTSKQNGLSHASFSYLERGKRINTPRKGEAARTK